MRTSPSVAPNNRVSHQIPHLYIATLCDNKDLTVSVTKTGVGMQLNTMHPLPVGLDTGSHSKPSTVIRFFIACPLC